MYDIDYSGHVVPGVGVDAVLTCKKSGKPITVSNKYGMFCEDKCDLQENKDANDGVKQIDVGPLRFDVICSNGATFDNRSKVLKNLK